MPCKLIQHDNINIVLQWLIIDFSLFPKVLYTFAWVWVVLFNESHKVWQRHWFGTVWWNWNSHRRTTMRYQCRMISIWYILL